LDKFTDDTNSDQIPASFIKEYKDKFDRKFVESFGKRSVAIQALAEWSMCAINMTFAKQSVMPLRKKNERLINDLESKKKSLRTNQTALKELKEQKDACDKDIKKSNEEIEFYQNEIKKSSAKVERCRSIYEGLSGERVRWSESVKKHEESNNKIVGDCILGAAFLTY